MGKHTDHTLAHTGQNCDYELYEVFFEQLSIRKPDYFMNAAGTDPAETIANVIKQTDVIFNNGNILSAL